MLKNVKICLIVHAGGSSMSGIAQILIEKGYSVYSFDVIHNERTRTLENLGAKFFYQDLPISVVNAADIVIHSSVEKSDSVRLRFSIPPNIPVVSQFEFIQTLARDCEIIAITGSYGKTITTSLISQIFDDAGQDVSFTCGGNVKKYNRNSKLGSSNLWIIEAVETHNNLLYIIPKTSIILNIEDEAQIELFAAFIEQTKGTTLVNLDDENCLKMLGCLTKQKQVVHVGINNEKADYNAVNIVQQDSYVTFDLNYKNFTLGSFTYNDLLAFSPYNVIMAATVCHLNGIPPDKISESILNFCGVENRFEIKLFEENRIFVTDIAHHPYSIYSSLQKCRNLKNAKVLVLYQPHMYEEVNKNAFLTAKALSLADKILLQDVLSFKDRKDTGLDSADFINGLEDKSKWEYVKKEEQLMESLGKFIDGPVLIIQMGMYQKKSLTQRILSLLHSTNN